jgi:dTDP-4-dehydrorhamnose reductase
MKKNRIAILGKRSFLSHAIMKEAQKSGLHVELIGSDEILSDSLDKVEKKIALLEVDAVFNCIAYTAVDLAEKETEKAKFLNADFPHLIGLASEKLKIQAVHFSTDYVFDGLKGSYYLEEDQPNPQNVYGQTKLLGENKFLSAHSMGLVIRTAWLYGFGKKNYATYLIDEMIKHKKCQAVFDQMSSPTFIDDLAKMSLKALGLNGVFHLANQGQASRLDCAHLIKKLLEKKDPSFKEIVIDQILLKELNLAAKRPNKTPLAVTKFEKAAKIRIRSWQEAMEEFFYQYLKANHA